MKAAGHDALHMLGLPLKNRTPDAIINQISVDEQRVVVTKDADFRDSYLVKGQPYKFLIIHQ